MAEANSGQQQTASSTASKPRSSRTATKKRSNGRAPASAQGAKRKAAGSRSGQGSKQASSRQRSKQASRDRPARSTNGRSKIEAVTEAVSSSAQSTAQGAAGAAKKAKGPLIAGGVAIAGLAGAAALNGRSSRRKVLGVKMPRVDGVGKDARKALRKVDARKALKSVDARKIAGSVTDAAKRADRFGQRVSGVASSVQTVSETADRAAKKA